MSEMMINQTIENTENIDQKALELAQDFSYDGYQVVRRELFAHLREPAVVIRRDSVTFNTACIAGLLKYTQMGVYAIVSTTTVIMLCINLFFNPVYAAYNLKISVKVYYKVIFKHLISAAIMVGGFIGIARVIRPSSWIGLIVSAIIMCISGLIIHVLIMCNMDEKLFLIKKITKRK